MMEKERVDALLVHRGLARSRDEAKRLVMAGLVMRGTERVLKPGEKTDVRSEFTVRRPSHGFVSRGGVKLEHALDFFGLSVAGRVLLDVGASTGGFTDCLLQRGAGRVYAVDVGYGQLAWPLRQDPRVRVMERMNFRHATGAEFDPLPYAAVIDVSFISLSKLWSALDRSTDPGGWVVALVKPQFEAGPNAGRRGVIKDPRVHADVLRRVLDESAGQGFFCRGLTYSPIRGAQGNIEFLGWFARTEGGSPGPDLFSVVETAHERTE